MRRDPGDGIRYTTCDHGKVGFGEDRNVIDGFEPLWFHEAGVEEFFKLVRPLRDGNIEAHWSWMGVREVIMISVERAGKVRPPHAEPQRSQRNAELDQETNRDHAPSNIAIFSAVLDPWPVKVLTMISS